MTTCSSCGKDMHGAYNFCTQCGTKLQEELCQQLGLTERDREITRILNEIPLSQVKIVEEKVTSDIETLFTRDEQ